MNSEQEQIESLIKKLDDTFRNHNTEIDLVDITISYRELLQILQGLVFLRQSHDATDFVKNSLNINMKSDERWRTVSEIMMIKDPIEKLSPHGDGEVSLYVAMIWCGMTPKKASEAVFKKHNFNSQEACDKWLQREIKRRKNDGWEFLNDIKAPSSWPRC